MADERRYYESIRRKANRAQERLTATLEPSRIAGGGVAREERRATGDNRPAAGFDHSPQVPLLGALGASAAFELAAEVAPAGSGVAVVAFWPAPRHELVGRRRRLDTEEREKDHRMG
jgi:hypothetical protein